MRIFLRGTALLGLVAGGTMGIVATSSPVASAASCSGSSGAPACAVSASVTVSAGTLSVESSPNLYWDFVITGYDQWASGSATALTSCAASGAVTHCSSGAAPTLEVLDGTGSTSGWAVSEYLSSNTLPSGSVLHFNGAGSAAYGYSQVSPITTDPFAGTTPGNVCDYGSSCTAATPATTCSHTPLGFTTCPTYPVTIGGSSATTQVDLYSAASGSGAGAICFATGTATATGCTGATPSAFYNLGVKGNTAIGSYAVTINLAVNSGP
ncbi:MAG TPA: hypothetical protein VME46_15645 [Acidimicrobiales bacterium]|nr:hypothetical protein [Acidimicrobiales bacterium]